MYKSFRKKNFAFIAIILTLVVFTCCACTSITASIHYTDKNIQTIQKEQLPLTGPGAFALPQETFDRGSDVSKEPIGQGSITVNWNMDDKGILAVSADIQTNMKLKLRLSKDKKEYYYDITPYERTRLPLQMGSGNYTVELFENIKDTQYQKLFEKEVPVTLGGPNAAFLYASQMVDYNNESDTVKYAYALTGNLKNDQDKLNAIYNYVVKSISYDYNKITTITSGYIPDADEILRTRRGICFDYAVLMAVMLREAGIPAKLVMGYRKGLDTYHAWNEVYINGEWTTVDTTFDATEWQNGKPYTQKKNAALYDVQKIY